jgi:predicted nuclease with RNAse H fold
VSERRPIVVGIDVAEERKGLDLVALDGRRTIVASAGRLTVSQVVELVLGDLGPDLVCIDSPSGWSHTGRSRRSELELRTLGITAFSTPSDPGDHPFYRWMRVGFSIYRALSPTYGLCDGSTLPGTAVEVFPEATAVLLTGRLRDKDESKRVFRGQVLSDHGVAMDGLPTVDRIDAALAALTGVLALEGSASFLGDPAEGVVLVPVADLPAARLRRRPAGQQEPSA